MSRKITLQEDQWAVLLATIIITIVVIAATLFDTTGIKFPTFKWKDQQELLDKVLSPGNLKGIAIAGLALMALSAFAIVQQGKNIFVALSAILLLYLLAILSLIAAGNALMNQLGLEYVLFALFIGIILNNLFRIPDWFRQAIRSELYIKTGLIILGTSVLFSDIIKAGLPGILQAVLVVSVVWFVALWLCRKYKVDDEFGIMIASAVSICGVSAAIVAAGAIQGDKKKLSYVTTLVLLLAIPMLLLQPWIIRYFQIPEIVGGAWLGGTLDTTASVTAASELVGPQAVKVGVIIKFSQNVLIGVAGFLITSWWVLRNKNGQPANDSTIPAWKTILERFPKFVVGFILASLLFSFIIPAGTTKQVSGLLNGIRTLWFALAFVSIGMEAKFSELVKVQDGRPAIAFSLAQVFNIIWTLLIAYLLFSGILFSIPNIQ
ncbi:YeiH family protein [Flavihumibacter rivuli]|uniref:YeiH family protein n=1 Tax=Flavihumibacter rivuli TaxID=2838156 RepID=UPI001BDEB1EA|nr:putative sulfate exporter family transporter [Flavihumibacter rivuli]ULQ57781.1 YeiH family protein [Flavihumibacter rivuli]